MRVSGDPETGGRKAGYAEALRGEIGGNGADINGKREVEVHITVGNEVLNEGSFVSKLSEVQSWIDACKNFDGRSYLHWEVE